MKKRILIADDSKYIFEKMTSSEKASQYVFEKAETGLECLQKIEDFRPDLIIVKILIPKMHGIEILKSLRKDPKTRRIGVILTTIKPMLQDYHAAEILGADYYLCKPYDEDFIFDLLQKFFAGTLHLPPFETIKHTKQEIEKWYIPDYHAPETYLKLWGTRGSITVSGSEYVRFGGNTACLEARQGNDLIIIDAGTGIRPLAYEVLKMPIKDIHLFLGHTHWDHIIGFPFFEPLYHPDYKITIYAPHGLGKDAKELFTELLAYEFFPVRLDEVLAHLEFKEIRDQTPVQIGDLKIDFHYTVHPGITFGFKIHSNRRTIGYATDNEFLMDFHGSPKDIDKNHPMLEPHKSLISFFSECDLLIHEAQYLPEEYKDKVGWGHSSIANASVLAKYAEVPEWIVTHHDPKHSDDDLFRKFQLHKDILSDCQIDCSLHMAYDGLIVSL